uniref:Rubis-subs-bind domain-containing protein n=1 Tax=Steinernema glaseri TaxID=37863 RepID=A0A1I7XZ51_9BILA
HIVAGTRAVLRSSQATEKVLSSEEYLRLVDSLIASGAEIKFDGDERERAVKKETAAKVLKTMCELAERFIELSPETMLSRCEIQKKKEKDNGGNRSRGNGSR